MRRLTGCFAALALAGLISAVCFAEEPTDSARTAWKQKVLRRSKATPAAAHSAPVWAPARPAGWSREGRRRATKAEFTSVVDEAGPAMAAMAVDAQQSDVTAVPPDEGYFGPQSCASCQAGESCEDCGTCGPGAACGPAGAGCYEYGYLWAAVERLGVDILSRSTLSAGVHGFKGPLDQGRNGNFGFQEAWSFGGPLGDPWGIGYQAGVQAVHSNFSGDQASGLLLRNDRDQVFFTSGLFKRAVCGGLQWGVVYDLLRDTYRDDSTTGQIRTEISLVRPGDREIGFWGAFGVGEDDIQYITFAQSVTGLNLRPIDIYTVFYRKYFSGGGQGRVFSGVTGHSDAVLGGDLTVPLGTSWALENSFIYLVPNQGKGSGGQQRETWSVSMSLVWYPGREAACVIRGPYQPLLPVADNTWMLLDQQTTP